MIQQNNARGNAREHATAAGSPLMRIAASVLILAGMVSVLFAVRAVAAPDEARSVTGAAVVRQAQVLDLERTGVASPAGLAFSSVGDSFYVVDAKPEGASTDVVTLKPFKLSPVSDRAGSARIAAAVNDPVNVAFDVRRNRLLLLDSADRLLEVKADPNGDLDPSTLVRRDALRLDLRDAQGMTVDPASGSVFILDAGASRILRIDPGTDGNLDAAAISTVDLEASGVSGDRGLAFDPSTGHLHLRRGQALHELTTAGEVVATRDLSDLGLASPAGMAFASSGDQTDAPGEVSVYVADSGGTKSSGQIMEVSLTPLAAPAEASFTSTLVNTVDMAALSPPSSDPSGITYLPASDSFMITDGEVEETVNGVTHFVDSNVWELTRSGSIIRTANISTVPPTVVPMTNEPAGVTFNPTNGHYYVAADGARRIYDLNPGADGLVGTAGDTWTHFSTVAGGNDNGDPEGITYNTFNGRLYVADGVNREIYEYETNGTLVSHFDVLAHGVNDPESVEFNPVSGTLFTLSQASLIVETTTGGTLLDTIDVSASGGLKHAGLAYAPATSGSPGSKSFYIADRGIDNNDDPDAVDGKLFELSAPTPSAPANMPPVVDAGSDAAATLPANVELNGDATDDGNPTPPSLTTTWTQVSGPGALNFGDASAVDTTASVPIAGIYVVRLTASDGEFTALDDVTLTFSGSGSVESIDVRVNANPDDAEEVAGSGAVQRGDGDLDMMTDTADTKQVVGLRLNGVAIPQAADITFAYVQFQADEADSVSTSLTIKGQAADNPVTFSTTAFDISSRPTTTAAATWVPDPWLAAGDALLAQRSSDLAEIIQEIVNRPGWASGNSLVLLVTGSGERVAVAHNQIAAAAPLLHVEWTTGSGNSPPQITSDGGGDTASVLPAENQTFVTDVDATDPDPDTLTYSISGGADQTAFAIVPSTGVLTFVSPPDFEAPTDVGADNIYDVIVQSSDGEGGSDSQAIAAAVQNVNEFSPEITSDGGGPTASLSRPDNQTQVTDVNATDGDNQALTYSISGGADQTAFAIVPSTGVLTFVSPPDFGAPTDVGADNIYDVIVSASDGSLSDAQTIAVTVTENSGSALYFSLVDVATVGGVTAENEDILYFDGTTFSLAFDGSDVGLTTFRIDAFSWLSATSLFLSFDAAGSVPGIARTVDDSDLVLFTSTSLGADTAGTFSLYFDGSDVGLTTSGEDVDAVELLPGGRILISTVNTVTVAGLTGEDEDLLEFVPTSIGPTTAGTFAFYFDGSDVGLTATGEDVDAAAVDAAGNIYLSVFNNFSVPGVSGADEDVFVFTPTSTGTTTAGTFSPTLYFDGSTFGIAANDVFAIDLP